jgi:hypothetical protein
VRNINVHKDVVSLCGNGGILKQCPVKTEFDREIAIDFRGI